MKKEKKLTTTITPAPKKVWYSISLSNAGIVIRLLDGYRGRIQFEYDFKKLPRKKSNPTLKKSGEKYD